MRLAPLLVMAAAVVAAAHAAAIPGEVTLQLGFGDNDCSTGYANEHWAGLALGPVPLYQEPARLSVRYSGVVQYGNSSHDFLSARYNVDQGVFEVSVEDTVVQTFDGVFACQPAAWADASRLFVGAEEVRSFALVAGAPSVPCESAHEYVLLALSGIAGATIMLCAATVVSHLREQRRAGYAALEGQ